jgi:hypothetical protein
MRGPYTRLHGRIPQAGPCFPFRRVGDYGRNPLWAGTVLALPTESMHSYRADIFELTFAKTVTAQRVFHYVRDS